MASWKLQTEVVVEEIPPMWYTLYRLSTKRECQNRIATFEKAGPGVDLIRPRYRCVKA